MRRFMFCILICVALTGCGGNDATKPVSLHVAAMAGPLTMNPVFLRDAGSAEIAALLHTPLVTTNPNTLEPEPRLFSSWECKEDNLTYVFTVNPQARWTDGRPVSAQDVAFTLRVICHPDYTGWLYLPLQYIAGAKGYKGEHPSALADHQIGGITVVDEKTLIVRLEQPYAPFLSMLTFAPLPAHVLEKVPVAEMEAHSYSLKLPVSAGPYLLAEWRPDEYIHVRANPDYFLGKPAINELFYRVIPNPEAQIIELFAGKLDLIPTAVKVEDVEALTHDPDVRIYTNRRLVYDYIALNMKKQNSPLADPRVRQALSLLIDREEVVNNLLLGFGDPLYGPLLPVHFAYDQSIKESRPNLPAARRLLLEAGYNKLELKLIFNVGNLVRENVALLLKEQAAKVGIDIQVALLEWDSFLAAVNTGDYDLAVLGRGVEADPDLYFHWHSQSAGNLLGYQNDEVDTLLADATKTLDKQRRTDMYREAQRLIAGDVPVIWLYARQAVHAANARLEHFIPHPESIFYNVHQWTLAAEEEG